MCGFTGTKLTESQGILVMVRTSDLVHGRLLMQALQRTGDL